MSDEEQIGYAEAMRELEEILDALEDACGARVDLS